MLNQVEEGFKACVRLDSVAEILVRVCSGTRRNWYFLRVKDGSKRWGPG